VGKPNERERDLLFSFRKVQNNNKYHISSQGKYLTAPKLSHINSASKSVPNLYCCTTSSVPRFSCPQSVVQTVLYGPETTNKTSKTVPKNASIFVPNPYGCTDCTKMTVQIRTVRPPTSRKIIRPKTHKIFFLGFVPSFLGKCALFAAHFPLSSLLRKSLSISSSMSSQHVLHTTQYILL
jgi:hypothetical protein